MVNRFLLTGCLLLLIGGWSSVTGAEKLHDPLRPSGYSASVTHKSRQTKVEKAPVWRLTAVLYSKSRLVAVINDRTVQVGDLLSGYRVKAIERSRVVLRSKGRTIVVRRVGARLKKPATAVGVNGKEGSAQ